MLDPIHSIQKGWQTGITITEIQSLLHLQAIIATFMRPVLCTTDVGMFISVAGTAHLISTIGYQLQ